MGKPVASPILKAFGGSCNTFGIINLTAAAAELAKEVSRPTQPVIRKNLLLDNPLYFLIRHHLLALYATPVGYMIR